jgi:hypothetical protein
MRRWNPTTAATALALVACGFDSSAVGSTRSTGSTAAETSEGDPSSGGSTTGTGTTPPDSTSSTGSSTTQDASSTDSGTSTGCRLQTWYFDGDLDGFGEPDQQLLACDRMPGYVAMADDCNDANNAIHPDADELCDGVDNDCDGGIDEGSAANGACGSCSFFEDAAGPGWYAACNDFIPWANARARCQSFGGDLVVITSSAQDAVVAGFSTQIQWIGVSDFDQEGHWVWVDGTDAVVDGTTVGYGNWGSGQPNNAAGGEDCAAHMPEDIWNDLSCEFSYPSVCQHPR